MATNVIARKASIVPSVTMKEGIRVNISNMPLIAPNIATTKSERIAASRGCSTPSSGAPSVMKAIKLSAETPMIEPTDKSNSPEIINIVTPMAMMPLVDTLDRKEAIELCSRKISEATAKKKKIAIAPMMAPALGDLASWVRIVFVGERATARRNSSDSSSSSCRVR